MKSKQLLNSFIAYCESNPEQGFWQALRNWSGYKFIYVKNTHCVCGGKDATTMCTKQRKPCDY